MFGGLWVGADHQVPGCYGIKRGTLEHTWACVWHVDNLNPGSIFLYRAAENVGAGGKRICFIPAAGGQVKSQFQYSANKFSPLLKWGAQVTATPFSWGLSVNEEPHLPVWFLFSHPFKADGEPWMVFMRDPETQ